MKKRGQGKSRRIFAVFICLCVLFTTQPEIWKGFTVYAAEESDTKAVFSFADLTEEVKEQTVTVGTDYEKLELPEELTVFISQAEASFATDTAEEKNEEDFEREQEIVTGITWQSEPEYDENTAGTYIFTAILPGGYTLAEGIGLPEITVTVQENEEDAAVQALLDRIAALPYLEEYLAAEPDMDEDEDAYDEWLETLYAYAEEVLSICEEYESLTEDRKAQIPEAEMAKLTAWAEFAETLADSMAVMTVATSVASGTCGSSLTWTLDSDGTLTISGSGAMTNFSGSAAAPWFDYKGDIKMVTIKDGVTSIGSYAFSGYSSLTGITIPSSVTSIGTTAFYGCSLLTSIEIPSSVTSIGSSAFKCCSSLTSIKIPSGVTSIEAFAFYECSKLESIQIPDSVTSIGMYAFYKCSKLTSITIPSGVTSIGQAAFYGCSELPSITIPSGVTSIENSTFYNCSLLTSITISFGVTSIGGFAFYNCSSLTSIEIPGSVTSIGNDAFRGCKTLTSIEIPESVTSIGDAVFYDCSSLTSIKIPSGVTSIGTYAFYNCRKLTSIEILGSVTSIGTYAFQGCSSLTSIEIPESVTSIGTNAFYGCSSLTSIEIPESVTSIGNSAFSSCSSLALVIMEGTTPATLGTNVFKGCKFVTDSRKDLVVPTGTRGSYTAADNWSSWEDFIHEDHDADEPMTAWTDSKRLPTTAGNYYLATDVTLGAAWSVPSGTTNLCLNGHVINKSTGSGSSSTIFVSTGNTLNLYDCQGNGTITVNGSNRVISVSGTLNLYGGTVTGGEYGVYMSGGEFNMYGGCIREITWNTGMGVCVDEGSFAMYGGSISDNQYGVKVESGGTLELSGNVVISGNSTDDVILMISNARYEDEEEDFGEAIPNASCYVIGELGEDAKIGIVLYGFSWNTYPLTAVTGTDDYTITQSDYEKFTSGDSSYPLNLNEDNEIEFLAYYTVTYDYATNGGISATKDSAQVLVKDDVDLTPTATKEGYTFVGWNTDSDATTALTSLTMGSAAVTLYAIYKVNTYYEVTLHGNGGSGTTLTSYTYGTGAVLPTDWERTGYSFDGWYDNESCTGTAVTAISTTDTENKEYWAKWVHIHSGTPVEAQEATCTEKGHSAYYICACGKWFSDSGCTQEVTAQDVTIKALGHDYSGNYQFDETGHWKECSRCQEEQQKQNHVYDNDEDRFCNECGYEREPERQDEGTLEKDAVVAEDAPIEQATLDNEKAELLAAVGIFTEEEKEEIAGDTNAKVWLEVTKTDESGIFDADKAAAIKAAREVMGGNTKLVYLDIDLFKQVEGRQKTKISEPGIPIKVSIRIPEALLIGDNTILREYKIIRLHNGEVTVIDGVFDAETGAFSFETDKFSTYAIAYSDTQLVTGITLTPESATLTKKGETLQLTATVTPDNAADKSVTWSSDNPLVATVDANGQVTAVSNGTAVITVTSGDGGKTAISTIQVEIPDNTESPNVSNEPDKKTESPKTGDDSNPAFWMILMLLSMTAMAGLLAQKRKPVRTDKK